MKKLKLYLAFLLLLLACGKEFEDDDILDTFDFNFSVIADDTGFVYEGSQADFRVVPERTISTTKFNFSYTISEGEGFFQLDDGQILEQQTEMNLEDLVWKLDYIPTTTGTHVVNVVAKDQKGNEKPETITYEIDFAPFTALFNKGVNTFVINRENALNLTVVSETNTELYESLSVGDIDSSYTLSFTVEGGTGVFVINGEEYEPGQKITVEEGTLEFGYVPSTLGEHVIKLIATAPDGAEREREIIVPVENVQFFLLASTPSEKIAIGEDIDVSLSLQSSDDSEEINYDLSFFYAPDSEGIGTLLDENGEPQTAGQTRPFPPGDYTYRFNSTVLGLKKIYFDVSDSNNQVKRDSILVDVTSVPFSFSGQSIGTSIGINQPIELSFNLNTASENNNDFNISYDAVAGNGTLRSEDDQVIGQNSAYGVEPGIFTLFYTPTSLGEHELDFVATDNFGEEMPANIKFTATNAQLSFTASSSTSEMFVGQTNSITVSLFEQGNFNLTYEMSFSVTGGIGTLTNRDGDEVDASEFFSIEPGTTPFSFIPEIPGNYTLSFILRDSNGQTLPAETSFVVSNTNFQFTANEVNDQVGTGEANPINFNIIPGSANTGTTYTMTYESNRNGSLNINGTTYSPGEQIPVQQGSFQGLYTPSLDGSYRLDFLVTDSNGIPQSDDASFTVVSRAFSIDAIASTNSVAVGESIPVNLTITETGGSGGTYTILVSSTANGTIQYNGQTFAQGEAFVVNGGQSTFNYVGESSGTHTLTVSATASYGGTDDDTVSVTYNGNVFTFSATEELATANIGEAVGITFDIAETINGTDTYTAIFTNSNNGTFEYGGQTISPGQSFNISVGNSSGNYIASAGGEHVLDFEVTSSSGQNESDDASITISETDFTFEAIRSKPLEIVDVALPINFTFSQTTTQNLTYTMVFSSSSTGIVNYNGINYSAGQSIPIIAADINAGNWSADYTGSVVGEHQITYTLTASNNVSRPSSITVDIVPSNPVLNSLSFSEYKLNRTEPIGTINGVARQKYFMELVVANIDFSSVYPISQIIINGEVYDYNLDYVVGYLDYGRSTRRGSCARFIEDRDIRIKKGRSYRVQIVNDRNEFSNEITVETPSFYIHENLGCPINDCPTDCTY
ncbi:MAG: TraQ conjugal transfer family protein [Bacteroidota bacterium]